MTLDSLTNEELVARFVSFSEKQYPLLLNDQISEYNLLVRKQTEIDKELRKRGVGARLELTKLFNHPNIQVRMNAARHRVGVARESALNVLRQITKEDFGPFRLHAGMAVALIEDGTITPT